ncbi:MAG: hypothetical protein AAFU77_04655 [Myxococcota bacterium]
MRWLLLVALLLEARGASAVEADSDPLVLHARALLAEADRDQRGALEMLRRAATLKPLERDVAFDLARISLATSGTDFVADSKALLTLDLKSPDERVLGAHALLAREDLEGARALLEGLDDSEEAQALAAVIQNAQSDAVQLPAQVKPESAPPRSEVSVPRITETAPPPPAQPEKSPFRIELTLLGQYDDNPTVAPEDAVAATLGLSSQASPRLAVDLGVGYTLAQSDSYVSDLRASIGYGYYTAAEREQEVDPEDLSGVTVDTESARFFNGVNAVVSYYNLWASSDWLFSLDSTVSGSTLDETELYSLGGSLDASALYSFGALSAGVYARGGYLYFDTSLFSDVEPVEDAERQGPTAAGGAVIATEFAGGGVRLQGRAGYQLEQLGENFDEAGLETDLTLSLVWGDVSLSALGGYSIRDYGEERSDALLTASANIGWSFFETYSLLGGYLLIQNTSDSDIFEYTRQVVFAGVQAVW